MTSLEGSKGNFYPDQVNFYRALQFWSKDKQLYNLKSQAKFLISLEKSINSKETKIVDSYVIPFMFDSALTFKDAEEGFERSLEANPASDLAVMRKNVLGYFGFEKINWEKFNSDGVEYKVAKFPKNPNAYLVRTLSSSSMPNHNVLKENVVVAPNDKEFHDFWRAFIATQPQLKAA